MTRNIGGSVKFNKTRHFYCVLVLVHFEENMYIDMYIIVFYTLHMPARSSKITINALFPFLFL